MNMFKKNEQEDTKTEETNSEEDTSTEESESTDTSSSEESNEDSNESDGDEDISKIYFTDPESLDPKLRGAFKKMQGIFTKKMQEATLGAKKARAFDVLITDPEFQKFMEERNERANGNTSKKTSRRTEDNSEDEEDDDTPMTRSAFRKEFQAMLNGMAQEGNRKEQAAAMKAEADQFKKDNPDWEIYKEPMMAIIERHPTLSYQDAYDLATREDNKQASRKESNETKKRANINKPTKVTGKTVEKKGRMSVDQAFKMAKKALGM